MLVVNKRTGQVEEFSTFEHYMDDELRERVAWELAPCSDRISWIAMYIFTMKLLQKNLRLIKEETNVHRL